MKLVIRIFLSIVLSITICVILNAQSFYFGPKLGPTASYQTWNGFDRDVLFTYHGALFIESYSEEGKGNLYAQVGYHKRGSAERGLVLTGTGNLNTTRRTFEFNNISVIAGAKQYLKQNTNTRPYYHVGIRGEYTIGTNLDRYAQFNGYFPLEPFVNKINYGFTAGGGYEFYVTDFITAFVELSFHPDVSKQYFQPPISNIIDPFRPSQTRTLREQEIRNVSIEISFGLKLLRKVEYYD